MTKDADLGWHRMREFERASLAKTDGDLNRHHRAVERLTSELRAAGVTVVTDR